MYDLFNRRIHYLRISVTDRCNLRCTYCMPETGLPMLRHEDILRYEEIVGVAKEAVSLGIDKIRITGGEPLVRKNIEDLVAMLAVIPGIRDFGLTTNGTLLEAFAEKLARAGLHRINISLDTTDPDMYREITRGGDILSVFRGIEAAKKAGLSPIKINCVVQNSSAEKDAESVRRFCFEQGLSVRFIRQMDLEHGRFSVVEGGTGGYCDGCNRLRLTANGMIKPCLFNDMEFSIREMGTRNALLEAVNMKPRRGTGNTINRFNNIGG